MTIVLDENAWAKQMIDTCSLGRKPYETLYRVARYYIDNGSSRRDARRKLEIFMGRCDPLVSIPKWSKTIDYALSRALKTEAVKIDCIPVTTAEIETIRGLEGKQQQRLAFTLLCLAKYWNIVNHTEAGWVNTPDNEIMRMSNVNTSIDRQSAMYHSMYMAGLLQFSKKVDNTNVRVCFMHSGETALEVTDFRNLGNQYMMFCGEPYFACKRCGIVTRRKASTGRKPVYCADCASTIAIQNRINSVMSSRSKSVERPELLTKTNGNLSASEADDSVT